MTDRFIHEVFFPLFRIGLGAKGLLVTLEVEDVEQLLHVGIRQSLIPIMWQGMKTIDCQKIV